MPRSGRTTEKPSDAAQRTQTGAQMRKRLGEREHEEIELKLAHYLPEGNPFTGEETPAGETVTLKRHQARHLIAAGYGAVDAEDAAAVNEALGLAAGEPGSVPDGAGGGADGGAGGDS